MAGQRILTNNPVWHGICNNIDKNTKIMNPIIISICLAFCIAGLLVVLIGIVMKFVGFIGKAIVKEPCEINITGNLIFAFIFSFAIVFLLLM